MKNQPTGIWAVRNLPGWVASRKQGDGMNHLRKLALALIAFMQSRRGQSLDGTTKFLARAPLALVTIGVLIVFLRVMTGV
jgi:hypothetical protein